MANTMKNLNFPRVTRRAEAKLHLRQSQYTGLRPLGPAPDPKPPQATICRLKTARSLAYLERHELASFGDCKLAVAIPRQLYQGTVIDYRGIPSYGV